MAELVKVLSLWYSVKILLPANVDDHGPQDTPSLLKALFGEKGYRVVQMIHFLQRKKKGYQMKILQDK